MSLVTLAQPRLLLSLGVALHKVGLGLFRARQRRLLAVETGRERPGPCATRDNFRQTGDHGSQAFSNIQNVTGEKSNSLKIGGHMSKRTFYHFPMGLSGPAPAGRSRDRPRRGHLAIKSSLGALGPKPLAPSLCPLLGQPGRTEAASVSPQDCLGLALGSGQRGARDPLHLEDGNPLPRTGPAFVSHAAVTSDHSLTDLKRRGFIPLRF